jgi:hypothetical protein
MTVPEHNAKNIYHLIIVISFCSIIRALTIITPSYENFELRIH